MFVTDVYGRESFWGVVSAVVDAQRLYAYSGLLDPELGLDITLRGRDGGGSNGDVFFGKPVVLSDHPVLSDVSLPTGSWQLAARPVEAKPLSANPTGYLELYRRDVRPMAQGAVLIHEPARAES